MLEDDKKRYGMKDGGDFPDLNKDGKVTYADVLMGRGVREQKAVGGIIRKLIKLSKTKKKPEDIKKQEDVDKLLDRISDENYEKLSDIEKEQLLDLQLEKYGTDYTPAKSTKKDRDDILDNLTDKEIENLTPLEREQLLDMEIEKYGVDGRKSKMFGGLLSDDRQAYGVGSIVKKLIKNKPNKNTKKIKELEKEMDDYLAQYRKLDDEARQAVKKAREDGLSHKEKIEIDELYSGYYKLLDENISDVAEELEELGIKVSMKNLKERKIPSPREAGDYKKGDLLPLNKGGMLSDENMEDNYTDFIMSEALTEEEEDMLTQKLEQDEQLAMLFDKVIDVAQEFAGSGPVEGPGSGVSDSIPARLSDGEFVFTAKAVKEIGADKLMAMMKDAEMKADERQQAQYGGLVMEDQPEKIVQTETRIMKPADATSPAFGVMEDDLIEEEVARNMLDPRVQHVRS